jgi:hypothetical protein
MAHDDGVLIGFWHIGVLYAAKAVGPVFGGGIIGLTNAPAVA